MTISLNRSISLSVNSSSTLDVKEMTRTLPVRVGVALGIEIVGTADGSLVGAAVKKYSSIIASKLRSLAKLIKTSSALSFLSASVASIVMTTSTSIWPSSAGIISSISNAGISSWTLVSKSETNVSFSKSSWIELASSNESEVMTYSTSPFSLMESSIWDGWTFNNSAKLSSNASKASSSVTTPSSGKVTLRTPLNL